MLAGLRFINSHKDIKVDADLRKRFLECALSIDSFMFYTVYKFFEQRKEVDEHYSKVFVDMFEKNGSNGVVQDKKP